MEGAPLQRTKVVVTCGGLQALIDALAARGYEVLGPTVCDGAIIYDTISDLADLPAGWIDRQEAGRYQLQRRDDDALFGFNVGPQSWKHFLHPPAESLWTARKDGDNFTVAAEHAAPPCYAFLGVRSCELNAIRIQDRIFCEGPYVDASYQARRREAFIVAVNCGQAGATCFCASMHTGPEVDAGFDLALTEFVDGQRHEFLLEAGSGRGAEVLARLPHRAATDEDLAAATAIIARAEGEMGRRLGTDGIKDLLQHNLHHPRWDDVGARCLTCGNCTMVCPTCFCTTVEDHSDLAGTSAERIRHWDSCFTMDFSYIHGGSVRKAARARYRQWMTHKLAGWIDQFGSSGCVGCGRCITWCPVGIDITAEAAAIRAARQATEGENHGDG